MIPNYYKYLPTLLIYLLASCNSNTGEYVCTPCSQACDHLTFEKPGICTECKMKLIHKDELLPAKHLNVVNIKQGSGRFLIEGGSIKEKSILVHFYQPELFSSNSSIIIVLPGSGRNGADYRDAWIESAEKYNLFVLSLEYPKEHYPGFWSYNLAGMINNVNVQKETYNISLSPKKWILNDFDRIFNEVKNKLNLEQNTFDLFGHSAGSQLLHRNAIYNSQNQANRIVAANAGWYTLPTDEQDFPYGMAKSIAKPNDVDFSSNLIILLGGNDNANETRGDLRRSPEVDLQGLHRLARGEYFYRIAKNTALSSNKEFNWQLSIVPNVGHDYKAMSMAAADYLYKNNKNSK